MGKGNSSNPKRRFVNHWQRAGRLRQLLTASSHAVPPAMAISERSDKCAEGGFDPAVPAVFQEDAIF